MLRNLSTCTPLRIEQGKISLMGCNSAGQIVYGVTCRVGYCRKYGNMKLRLANSLKSLAIFGVFPNIITGAGTTGLAELIHGWQT